jgi:aryl-alcohol dehydrogenase-like predicted oxidoreductase
MRYLEVGGVRLSVVGLGTWQFGSPEWGYGRAFAEGEALRITERALDLGINLIDTAELYGLGRSERAVGQAIRGRRDEAFIATKVLPVFPFDPIVHQRALASRRRLGIDRIDLYQAHWPNPVFPPRPLFEAFAQLQRQGIVTHLGVSNYSLAAWQTAERLVGGPVLSNQVQYNLVDRRPEHELIPWAQHNDRLIIAYSPLAQGLLTGSYSPTKRPGSMRALKPLFLPENLERAEDLVDALRDVAIKHSAEPAQVALAWLIRQPNVIVIPGASSVGQLEFNAAAADLQLTDEDDERLREASDRFRPLTGLDAVRAVPTLVRTRLPI